MVRPVLNPAYQPTKLQTRSDHPDEIPRTGKFPLECFKSRLTRSQDRTARKLELPSLTPTPVKNTTVLSPTPPNPERPPDHQESLSLVAPLPLPYLVPPTHPMSPHLAIYSVPFTPFTHPRQSTTPRRRRCGTTWHAHRLISKLLGRRSSISERCRRVRRRSRARRRERGTWGS